MNYISVCIYKLSKDKDNEFDEVAQKEYHESWERAFKLLEE